MRGPGCCLGTCVGLVLGVALAAGLVVAAARWAPGRLESAVRWALDAAPAPGAPPAAAAERRPGADRKGKEDPKMIATRRRVRERLRRLLEDSRRGVIPKGPIEFTEPEVQAALTDPEGILEGGPPALRADLEPGIVRLSWEARLFEEGRGPAWLARLPGVRTSVALAPRVENGRLLCPPVGARFGPVPIPAQVLRALVPILPSAPPLPPRAGVLLPAGVGWIEVLDDRVRVAPDPPWMAPAQGAPPGA